MAISMKELSSVKLKKTAGEKQGVERTQSLDPNFHILSGQAAKKGAYQWMVIIPRRGMLRITITIDHSRSTALISETTL